MVCANDFLAVSDGVFNNIEGKEALISVFTRADRFVEASEIRIVLVNSLGSVIERQDKRSREFSKHIYVFEGSDRLITQVRIGDRKNDVMFANVLEPKCASLGQLVEVFSMIILAFLCVK